MRRLCRNEDRDPIQMSQPGDQDLTCAQINDQIYTNQVAAVNFVNQAAKVEGSNTASLAFPAAWQHSLCLQTVGGGETWNLLSQAGVVEDTAFREALEKTLAQNQLLA